MVEQEIQRKTSIKRRNIKEQTRMMVCALGTVGGRQKKQQHQVDYGRVTKYGLKSKVINEGPCWINVVN